MSNLSDDDLKRIRQIRWAATGESFDKFGPVSKADVRLIALRLEDMELAEHAVADEMLRWMLERLKEDRKSQRDWLADLLEQIHIAELQALEADQAVKAVEALLAGGLYVAGDEITRRWDAVKEEFRSRGLLPDSPVTEAAPDPTAEIAPPVVADLPSPPDEEPLPAELVAQLSKPAQKALTEVSAPAAREPGALSYTRPGDPLTDKQAKVFRAILSAVDQNWRSQISQGRIAKVAGEKPGGIWAHLEALEKKDYIRILDRGNSKTPGQYLICEHARPSREAMPKTDAELIAEALAAGKVTACPAPGAGLH